MHLQCYASQCGLKIDDLDQAVRCSVGGGQVITFPRRVAKARFDLLDLGTLETMVFVMDPIPVRCDVLFGMDFLRTVNPNIDWQKRRISVGPSNGEAAITQPVNPSNTITDDANVLQEEIRHQESLFVFQEQTYESSVGPTQIISSEQYEQDLKQFQSDPDTFFFIISPIEDSGKVARFKTQNCSWKYCCVTKIQSSRNNYHSRIDRHIPKRKVDYSIALTWTMQRRFQ